MRSATPAVTLVPAFVAGVAIRFALAAAWPVAAVSPPALPRPMPAGPTASLPSSESSPEIESPANAMPAAPDAARPAAPSPSRRRWLEVEEDRIRFESFRMDPATLALYRKWSQGTYLMKSQGPIALRPLGQSAEQFVRWRERHGHGTGLFEPYASVTDRLRRLYESMPTRASDDAAQMVAYATGDSLEVVGTRASTGPTGAWTAEWLLPVLEGPLRATGRTMDPAIREQVIEIAERAEADYQRARIELHHITFREVLRKSRLGQHERGVVVAYLADSKRGGLRLLRRGADPALDRLLFERDEAEAAVRQAVEAALRG